MSSFKQLSRSDVTVVANQANKQWTLPYCPYPTSSGYLTIYKGTNVTGAFSADNDPVTEGEYERLVYAQVNQMFYQTYTASLNTSSLMFTLNNYQSASQQRPTSSYFIYNDNDNLIVNFPTGAMDGIRVVAINQSVFGNKVLPGNFQLSSSAYNITDDAYGNLFDYSGSKTHVGNIFYAQGLAIITNQDYQLMFPLPPLAKNDSGSFLTTDSPKTISASLNDDGRSGTLNTGSILLSGSASDLDYWSTGSNGTVLLTTTMAGTYTIYYTISAEVASSCPITLRSNKAKVTAVVAEPTTTTTSTTTTTTTAPTTTTTTSTTTSTTTIAPTTTTTTSTTTSTTTVACVNKTAVSLYGGVDTAAACANTSSGAPDAYACVPNIGYDMFNIGTAWFLESGRINPYPTGSYAVHNGSLSNDNTWVIIGSGSIVQSTGSCVTPTTTTTTTTTSTTTTTTTVAYYTWTGPSSFFGDSGSACSGYSNTTNYYSPQNIIVNGTTRMYTDTNLAIPVETTGNYLPLKLGDTGTTYTAIYTLGTASFSNSCP
jgi:hypothetical protein